MRPNRWGKLFQGRCKSLIVEEDSRLGLLLHDVRHSLKNSIISMTKMCFLLSLFPMGLHADLYSELMGGKVLNCETTAIIVSNEEWDNQKTEAGGIVKASGRLFLDTNNTKEVVVQVDSYKVIDSRGIGVPTITSTKSVIDMSAFLLSGDTHSVKDYTVSHDTVAVELMSAALHSLKISRLLESRKDGLTGIEAGSLSCHIKRANDSIFVTTDQTSIKGVWASYKLGLDSFPDVILWSMGIGDSSAEQRVAKLFRENSDISFEYHLTQITIAIEE